MVCGRQPRSFQGVHPHGRPNGWTEDGWQNGWRDARIQGRLHFSSRRPLLYRISFILTNKFHTIMFSYISLSTHKSIPTHTGDLGFISIFLTSIIYLDISSPPPPPNLKVKSWKAKQVDQSNNLANQYQWGIVPWEPIKQFSQFTTRFKLCNGFCQLLHLVQICCPKTNKILLFYYSTSKTCLQKCEGEDALRHLFQFSFLIQQFVEKLIFATFWSRLIFAFRQKGCPEEPPLLSGTWISLVLQVPMPQNNGKLLSTTFHLTKKSKLIFWIEELSKGGGGSLVQ